MRRAVSAIKKARVGERTLKGESLARAMKSEGLSPATARNPTQAGYGADACVAAAIESRAGESLANARRSARRLLNATLADAKPNKVPLLVAARVCEIVERISTGADDPTKAEINPEDFGKRLAWLAQVQESYRRTQAQLESRGPAGAVDLEPVSLDSSELQSGESGERAGEQREPESPAG